MLDFISRIDPKKKISRENICYNDSQYSDWLFQFFQPIGMLSKSLYRIEPFSLVNPLNVVQETKFINLFTIADVTDNLSNTLLSA